MEESSNGKVEEIQKVETRDADKELIVEDSGVSKTDAESVREIVANGNSESVNENQDGDYSSSHRSSSDEGMDLNDNSTQKVDSGELDEEKIVKDSFVDSIEPKVSAPFEELNEGAKVPTEQLEAPDDVAELESKEIEAYIWQSLDEDETNEDSKSIEEVILPSSYQNNGSSLVVTEVVSKGIEELPLSSTEEKGIEQITLPSSNENVKIPPPTTADVVSKKIERASLPALQQNSEESSDTADLESKEKIDESLQETTNAGAVDTNNTPECNPESTGNPHIISLSQHTIQPTSWRSCCGLLDIFRRSDR